MVFWGPSEKKKTAKRGSSRHIEAQIGAPEPGNLEKGFQLIPRCSHHCCPSFVYAYILAFRKQPENHKMKRPASCIVLLRFPNLVSGDDLTKPPADKAEKFLTLCTWCHGQQIHPSSFHGYKVCKVCRIYIYMIINIYTYIYMIIYIQPAWVPGFVHPFPETRQAFRLIHVFLNKPWMGRFSFCFPLPSFEYTLGNIQYPAKKHNAGSLVSSMFYTVNPSFKSPG